MPSRRYTNGFLEGYPERGDGLLMAHVVASPEAQDNLLLMRPGVWESMHIDADTVMLSVDKYRCLLGISPPESPLRKNFTRLYIRRTPREAKYCAMVSYRRMSSYGSGTAEDYWWYNIAVYGALLVLGIYGGKGRIITPMRADKRGALVDLNPVRAHYLKTVGPVVPPTDYTIMNASELFELFFDKEFRSDVRINLDELGDKPSDAGHNC